MYENPAHTNTHLGIYFLCVYILLGKSKPFPNKTLTRLKTTHFVMLLEEFGSRELGDSALQHDSLY